MLEIVRIYAEEGHGEISYTANLAIPHNEKLAEGVLISLLKAKDEILKKHPKLEGVVLEHTINNNVKDPTLKSRLLKLKSMDYDVRMNILKDFNGLLDGR